MLRCLVAVIVAASALLSSPEAGATDLAESGGSAAGVVARQLLKEEGDVLAGCLGDWTERELIGQLVVPGIDYQRLDEAVPLIEQEVIGGVVVLGTAGPDLAERIGDIREAAAVPPMIAVDEEGGRVQRLAGEIARE